jgi:hypothetical protein
MLLLLLLRGASFGCSAAQQQLLQPAHFTKCLLHCKLILLQQPTGKGT